MMSIRYFSSDNVYQIDQSYKEVRVSPNEAFEGLSVNLHGNDLQFLKRRFDLILFLVGNYRKISIQKHFWKFIAVILIWQ